jgi:hypothetical protein
VADLLQESSRTPVYCACGMCTALKNVVSRGGGCDVAARIFITPCVDKYYAE